MRTPKDDYSAILHRRCRGLIKQLSELQKLRAKVRRAELRTASESRKSSFVSPPTERAQHQDGFDWLRAS